MLHNDLASLGARYRSPGLCCFVPLVPMLTSRTGGQVNELRVSKTKDIWLAGLVLVAILGIVASLVLHYESKAKQQLRGRFSDRTEGGASFVGVYMKEMLDREARLAEDHLSGNVSPAEMATITSSFDSAASVLLDANGKLLAASPHDPKLIGTQVGAKYAHLSAALEGTPTISPVVQSAVEGIPVVGAAAPFDSPKGRRVFSAALSISGTPLADYLETMLPMPGAEARLIDVNGAQVVAGDSAVIDSGKSDGARPGHMGAARGDVYSVSRPVDGTPWTIVSTVPAGSLYAPFEAARWTAWVVFALLAASGALSLFLFGRYTSARLGYRYRANHCPLTGLANRDLLAEHTKREAAKLARKPASIGLLYLDLDDFKAINDNLGHEAGDALLKSVATRLTGALRPYDVAARIGGDEFAVLVSGASPREIEDLAQRVLSTVEQPYDLLGTQASIGASIGLATTQANTALEELLASADRAMYQAKTGGKGRVRLADTDTSSVLRAGAAPELGKVPQIA